MIHVAYGTSNLYSKFVGTSIFSMFDNTNEAVTVHILHDNTLTQENREKLVYIAGQYNQQIKFYNAEKLCTNEIAELKKIVSPAKLARFNIATYFRLLVSKIIPPAIDKIIYLDADTIVNLDIKELWRVELENKPLAAVVDIGAMNVVFVRDGAVKPEDYFNVGIMLLDLNQIRKKYNTIRNGMEFVCNKYDGWDQDILNYCFSEEYLKLPPKFNTFVREEKFLKDSVIEKKLYHYLDNNKSLNLDVKNKFHRLYWEYFAKTPFFNEETIGNLFNSFMKIYDKKQSLLIQISALMSGKTRAFFTDIKNTDVIKNTFFVQSGEEILTLPPDNSIKNLIDSMTESRGKKVFFLMISQGGIYNQICDLLKKFGFIEGYDFLDGKIFLSEIHGVPLDSWEMIKNL